MQPPGFAHDIAHREGAEHPLLHGIGVDEAVVDDIVAVVGVAADGDAENFLHGRAVTVEGGAAEGRPLAEVCTLPPFAEFRQRDAPCPPDGIHQPHILLEEERGFHDMQKKMPIIIEEQATAICLKENASQHHPLSLKYQ